jgi:acyl-coenzyme A synthetase/AMP-(fatty) acid ligase
MARVVLNDGGTIDPGRASATIPQTGRQHLADFTQPRDILVLPNFPRAELGKTAKNKLKDLVGSSSSVSRGRRRCRTRVPGQENSLL